MTTERPTPVGDAFLRSAIDRFERQKSLAERAIAQVDDDDLHRALHPETNSIAVIIKHMAGNMRSRWTDFLTSDGEKPWRGRDDEFVDDRVSRAEIMRRWEEGWNRVFGAVRALATDDLTRTVTIRGHEHSVIDAIHRQLDHYGYHVGQIVQIARIHAGDDWETLSIARGESNEYNERTWKQNA